MHVLFLPSWYSTIDKPWRGTFFKDQARSLIERGLRVGVAFVERRSLSQMTAGDLIGQHFQIAHLEEDRIPTLRMKGWSIFAQTTAGSMLWVSLMRRLVHSYVATHGVPDVIHGHAAMWGGYSAMFTARELACPYILTEHASSILTFHLSRANRQRVIDVYGNAARVLAVSNALKASVDRVAGTEVAEVVPNTVDTAFFDLPPFRRLTRPFAFLAVGDLVKSKRFDMLIRAFGRLHMGEPNTRLVIVGNGKERDRLRELVFRLGLEEAVELTGAVARSVVRKRMWEANALVLPSDFETFGVVLIEALSTGLPVLATRCGGPEEIVTPDLGLLIDRNDERELLHSMREMLARDFDPAALRENVSRRFGYAAVGRRLSEIYETVAARQRKVA